MGRMSELHIELSELGLDPDNLEELNFGGDSQTTEQWWEHQDRALVAEELEAIELQGEMAEYRLNGYC